MQQVGEHHDSTEMYVDMAATARTEGLEEVRFQKLTIGKSRRACRFRAKKELLTALRTLTWKTRPESGLDCLICAIFARQRMHTSGPLGFKCST